MRHAGLSCRCVWWKTSLSVRAKPPVFGRRKVVSPDPSLAARTRGVRSGEAEGLGNSSPTGRFLVALGAGGGRGCLGEAKTNPSCPRHGLGRG